MGLSFYTAPSQSEEEAKYKRPSLHDLDLDLSYGSFDSLRDEIVQIADDSTLLNIAAHPGLRAYQNVLDANDGLTLKQCYDLYSLLQTSLYAHLKPSTAYQIWVQALHGALLRQENLLWF